MNTDPQMPSDATLQRLGERVVQWCQTARVPPDYHPGASEADKPTEVTRRQRRELAGR